MNCNDTLASALSLPVLALTAARTASAATEIYTSRAAFEARVDEINSLDQVTLALELQDFDAPIPGRDATERSGPASYTYLEVPLAVAAGGFGVHTSAGALGYQASGGSGAPLVVETSIPVNALGFDIIGFGSGNIDPSFVCFPPGYALEFTGGDLAAYVIDTEAASDNGDPGNSQFFGIVDVDSPFATVELNNTGFFDVSECGFPPAVDRGDTIRLEDLAFGVADFQPLCGDVDGDRMISGGDVDALRNSLAGLQPLNTPDNCSVVNGAESCDIADAVVVARSTSMVGSLPGIADVCRSNNLPPVDIAAGLVGYWPFDEPDGGDNLVMTTPIGAAYRVNSYDHVRAGRGRTLRGAQPRPRVAAAAEGAVFPCLHQLR